MVLVYRPPRSPETRRKIICQALTSAPRTRRHLKRQRRSRKRKRRTEKKSKITHDSICPAHPTALRRGSALLLAACRRPGSLCFPARSCTALALIPGSNPPPPGSRIQSGAQMVASAEPPPPSLPTPSPLLRLLPLHAAAGEKTRCSGSEHRGRRRRSQGDAGPLCSQTD